MNPAVPLERFKGPHPINPASSGNLPNGPFFSTCSFIVPNVDPTQNSCAPGATGNNFNGMFGNAPVGNILGPGAILDNVSLFKIFQVSEQLNLRFRAEAFNMVNHPNFSSPDVTLGDANFGAYTKALDPRQVEFALELRW
jgi:hypothetical protein